MRAALAASRICGRRVGDAADRGERRDERRGEDACEEKLPRDCAGERRSGRGLAGSAALDRRDQRRGRLRALVPTAVPRSHALDCGVPERPPVFSLVGELPSRAGSSLHGRDRARLELLQHSRERVLDACADDAKQLSRPADGEIGAVAERDELALAGRRAAGARAPVAVGVPVGRTAGRARAGRCARSRRAETPRRPRSGRRRRGTRTRARRSAARSPQRLALRRAGRRRRRRRPGRAARAPRTDPASS